MGWKSEVVAASARWVRATAQAVANSAQTTLQGPLGADLDVDHSDDPDGVFSISGGVVTVNEAGVYAITAGVRFDANGTGYRQLRILKNSTVLASDFSPSSAVDIRLGVSTGPVECAGGDTFHAESFQNSGGSLNINVTEFEPYVSVVRIS